MRAIPNALIRACSKVREYFRPSELERLFREKLQDFERDTLLGLGRVDPRKSQELASMASLLEARKQLHPRLIHFRRMRIAIVWAVPAIVLAASQFRLPATPVWMELSTESLGWLVPDPAVFGEVKLFKLAPEIRMLAIQPVHQGSLIGAPSRSFRSEAGESIQIDGCATREARIAISNPSLPKGSRIRLMPESNGTTLRFAINRPQHSRFEPVEATIRDCHVLSGDRIAKSLNANRGSGTATYSFESQALTLDLRQTPRSTSVELLRDIWVEGIELLEADNPAIDVLRERSGIRSGRIEFEEIRGMSLTLRENEKAEMRFRGIMTSLRWDNGVLIARCHGELSSLRTGYELLQDGMPTALDWFKSWVKEGSIGLALVYALVVITYGMELTRDAAKDIFKP